MGVALEQLIAKVEACVDPTWELHSEIISALISVNDADAKRFYGSGTSVLASLDAAVALVERVLPGWYWGVSVEPPVHGKRFHAVVNNIPVWNSAEHSLVQSADYAPSAALAITLATLKVKQAQESGNG